MRLLRRPALWAVILAAIFASTIGGGPLAPAGPNMVDNPSFEGALDERDDRDAANALSETSDSPGADVTETVAGGEAAPHTADTDSDANDGREDGAGLGGPTEEEAESLRSSRPEVLVHTVREGETLAQIASRYGIDNETILAANDLPNANVLHIGQELNILSIDGALHTVKRGENLWDIARTYRTDMDQIVVLNELENPNRLKPSQELVIPGEEAASIGSSIRSEMLVSANGRLMRAFSWPVRGRISSRYGSRWGRIHHGVDVAVNTGTHVKAAARGRVSFSGWSGGYGYLVVIDHGNQVETRYGHNSRLLVRAGQYVRRGTTVAYSGNTGRSTGPHVHFEIRYKGRSTNPLNYLQ